MYLERDVSGCLTPVAPLSIRSDLVPDENARPVCRLADDNRVSVETSDARPRLSCLSEREFVD